MSEPPQRCAYSTGGGHTGPNGVGTDQMQVDPALLQQDVSALRAENRELMAAIAHTRHDVSSLRGETREAFKVTFRNHHSLDERQSASEGQLKELASRPSPDSASSSPRMPHSGGSAHRRKGGGGTKKLRRANDAFRLLLRRALQISEQEPYPFYPLASKKLPSPEDPFVSTPEHLTGNDMSGNADKPLHPDWEVLKRASVLTLRFVDPFVDKILDQRDRWKISPDKGRADVQEACIGSLDKIRYEVRDRAKKGDESYNDKKRKSKISSRRRERRKERARARFVEFMRRTEEALEREWNDDDDDDDSQHEVDLHVGREAKRYLFVVDAMSEDETDEEASRNGLGSVGKVKIVAYSTA